MTSLGAFRPGVDADTQFYWEGASRGELLLQRCDSCDRLRHPPAPVCATCRSLQWSTQAATGRGRLHVVVQSHRPTPLQDAGYLICVVDLEEAGIRVVSNLQGCSLQEAPIGAGVELFFTPLADGFQLPVFRLAGATASEALCSAVRSDG